MKQRLKYIKSMVGLYPNLMMVWHNFPRARWVYLTADSKEAKERLKFEDYPNHYRIPPNEIIIDIDTDNAKDRDDVETEILARVEGNFTYAMYRNPSGKSHFHFLFDELDRYTCDERKLLKTIILRDLCHGLIRKGKIDMQLVGKHCVRMPYGEYEKIYPLVKFKEPEHIMKYFQFNELKQSWITEMKTKIAEIIIYITKQEMNGNFPCINYFLHEDFNKKLDCRKRALFIIASYFKNKGLSNQETFNEIMTWNNYYLNNHLKPLLVRSCIKSNNGSVGCRYRKELLTELGKSELCNRCKEQ